MGKLQAATDQPILRARFIVSLVGRIIAMSLAPGTVARFMRGFVCIAIN